MTAMPSETGWRPNDRCSIKVSPQVAFPWSSSASRGGSRRVIDSDPLYQ